MGWQSVQPQLLGISPGRLILLDTSHWIVIGLGFGDEGKGSLVDHLVRQTGADLLVRYNGGPQAAHHVVTPEGQTHCFAQVGAGSFSPGVETFLAASMFVDPLALEREFQVLEDKGLRDIRSRMRVDSMCPLVTPYHAWLNQIRELARGQDAHGTCGRGIGEAFSDLDADSALRVGDLFEPLRLRRALRHQRDSKLAVMAEILPEVSRSDQGAAIYSQAATPEIPDYLQQRYSHFVRKSGIRLTGPEIIRSRLHDGRNLIFEGAQGLLLHKDHGFWPHVTPSDTSSSDAHALLKQTGNADVVRTLGVLRGYLTRHGSGPLVTEDLALASRLPEPHNSNDGWQGLMRYGWFDAVATRYALDLDPAVDHLAITCLDRMDALHELRLCHSYRIRKGKGHERITELNEVSHHIPRTALTDLLTDCKPEYLEIEKPAESRQESLLSAMSELIGRRIDLISRGPASSDKAWR